MFTFALLSSSAPKIVLTSSIIALHVLIFNANTSLALKASLTPIKHGLQHWKELWDIQQILATPVCLRTPSVTNMWKGDGFMTHAGEYWALAIMNLERMQSPEPLRPDVISERYDDTDLEQGI